MNEHYYPDKQMGRTANNFATENLNTCVEMEMQVLRLIESSRSASASASASGNNQLVNRCRGKQRRRKREGRDRGTSSRFKEREKEQVAWIASTPSISAIESITSYSTHNQFASEVTTVIYDAYDLHE
jgi:hypothetical protein